MHNSLEAGDNDPAQWFLYANLPRTINTKLQNVLEYLSNLLENRTECIFINFFKRRCRI